MLKSVRDLGLRISEIDIARSAGIDKRSMAINRELIDALLEESKSLKAK
jgi:hypothetical protein